MALALCRLTAFGRKPLEGEGPEKVVLYLKNDKTLITSSQLKWQAGSSDKRIKHQKPQDGELCLRAPNIACRNVIHS